MPKSAISLSCPGCQFAAASHPLRRSGIPLLLRDYCAGGHGLNSPHKDERDLVNGRHGKIGQQMGLGMFVLAEVSRESRIESDDSYIEWLSRVCQPGF